MANMKLYDRPIESSNMSLMTNDIPGAQGRTHPKFKEILERDAKAEERTLNIISNAHWNKNAEYNSVIIEKVQSLRFWITSI